MPSGSASQLLAFKQYHIGDAEFRQVIGDRTSGDAPTDNDNIRYFWEFFTHMG
jgi:hypothetical protein